MKGCAWRARPNFLIKLPATEAASAPTAVGVAGVRANLTLVFSRAGLQAMRWARLCHAVLGWKESNAEETAV